MTAQPGKHAREVREAASEADQAVRALARQLQDLQELKEQAAARRDPGWQMAEICTAGWLGGIALMFMSSLIALAAGTVTALILLAGSLWLVLGSLAGMLIIRHGNKVP